MSKDNESLLPAEIEGALVDVLMCPDDVERAGKVDRLRELLLPRKNDFAKIDRFDGLQVLFFIEEDTEEEDKFMLHQIVCIDELRVDVNLRG